MIIINSFALLWTQRLTAAAMNGVWQSLLLVFLAWMMSRFTRRVNAAGRFVLWWTVLVGICGLFAFDLAGGPRFGRPVPVRPAIDEAVPKEATSVRLKAVRSNEKLAVHSDAAAPNAIPAPVFWKANSYTFRWPGLIGRWAPEFVSAWLFVFLFLIGRIFWSYAHLVKLKKTSTRPRFDVQKRIESILATHGIDSSIGIGVSPGLSMPMAAGLFKPMILVPHGLFDFLSARELEQVLLHEAAHLERKDDWWNLIQQICKAVFFFNPGVLIVSRQLEMAREAACDDRVLSATRDWKGYALCLTKLMEATSVSRHQLLAAGAWFSRSQLSRRIERLLLAEGEMPSRFSLGYLVIALSIPLVLTAFCAFASPVATFAAESPPGEKQPATNAPARDGAAPLVGDPSATARTERDYMIEELDLVEQELKQTSASHDRESTFKLKREIIALRRHLAEYDRSHSTTRPAATTKASPEENRRADDLKKDVIVSLLAALKKDSDENVKSAALNSLANLSSDSVIRPVEEFVIQSTNSEIRMRAVSIIGGRYNQAGLESLFRIYDAVSNQLMKERILHSLYIARTNRPTGTRMVIPASAIPKLKAIVAKEANPALRSAAIGVLGEAANNPDVEDTNIGKPRQGAQDRKPGQVFFTGQVRSGVFDLKEGTPTTLYEALVQVGFTEFADLAKVKINRIDPESKILKNMRVDVKSIAQSDHRENDPVLQDGDRVEVPEKGIVF